MSQAVTFLEQHDVEVPFLFFAQLPKKERKEKIKNWDGKQQGQSGKKQGWGWGSAWMGEPVTAQEAFVREGLCSALLWIAPPCPLSSSSLLALFSPCSPVGPRVGLSPAPGTWGRGLARVCWDVF